MATTTKLTIEQMQALAKERDGVCLSTTYVNAHTKLRWRCAEGHEWETTPDSVKGGSWCRRPRDVQGRAADVPLLTAQRGRTSEALVLP